MVYCNYCKQHTHKLFRHTNEGIVINCRHSCYYGRYFPSVEFFHKILDCGSCLKYGCETYQHVAMELWRVDNKLKPEKDYKITMKKDKLFSHFNDERLKRKTIAAFIDLLNNYEERRDMKEDVTEEEINEEYNFLQQIQATPPMTKLRKHLVEEGIISSNQDEFVKELHELWFKMYGDEDISAFEHIFVGEISCEHRMIGLHNWIQYYLQQEEGHISYKGFVGEEPGPHAPIVTIHFNWEGAVKPKSSMFVGTTPEFEMALYTLIFYCGSDSGHNPIWIGDEKVDVFCHKKDNRIITAYPLHIVNKKPS